MGYNRISKNENQGAVRLTEARSCDIKDIRKFIKY